MDGECKDKCISTGIAIFRAMNSLRADRSTPVIFAENVAGLVSPESMKIPHSELAMHVGAAGKELLAWVLAPNFAYVVFDDGGCCSFTHGLASEVLSHEVIERTRETWGPRGE